MEKKENTIDKIIDLIVETCFKQPEREKLGEKIGEDIKNVYEKLKENGELSIEELEVLKESYQILGNDSVQSFAESISLLTVFISILAIFISILAILVSVIDAVKDSFAEYFAMANNQIILSGVNIVCIVLIALFALFAVGFYKRMQDIKQENICFRNSIIASQILIYEKRKENNNQEDDM